MDKCIYNGKIINSFDIAANIDREMEIRQCNTLRCCNPDCDVPVRYRHGKIRIPYFAHTVKSKECDYDRYSGEKSGVFQKVQQELYDVLKQKYSSAVDIDVKIIKKPLHFTSIVLNGQQANFAIDIVDKSITSNELEFRSKAYSECGYIGIKVVIDEASDCEFSECYGTYLPIRYELNKSPNNSAVVYDKFSKKYYYLRYDTNKYGGNFIDKNVISREFNLSELTVTDTGIAVPRLDKEFSEWIESRYQKNLETVKRYEERKQGDTAQQNQKSAFKKETVQKLKYEPIEFHNKTGKYLGNFVNGRREAFDLNEIRITKCKTNYYKVYSKDEIEKMINEAFDFSYQNIHNMLTKMYYANNDEKAEFVRIYEEYLNAEQTEEVTERLKILEYAIQEAEIFR